MWGSPFDSNRNGRLDFQERRDLYEFQYADLNGDGRLNRGEFSLVENPIKFNLYDINKDGFVSPWEYALGERMTEHPYSY